MTVMDGVTNTGDTYRRASKICRDLGLVCLDWVALSSRTSAEKTRTPYIAWPNNDNSSAMVAWEDASSIIGISYTDGLGAIPVADTAPSKAFCDAQFAGAEALAGIMSAEDVARWTAPS
jgi:hypothetical protein